MARGTYAKTGSAGNAWVQILRKGQRSQVQWTRAGDSRSAIERSTLRSHADLLSHHDTQDKADYYAVAFAFRPGAIGGT